MGNALRLETSDLVAYITDNSPLGIHSAGYNGVASLIPKHLGNNLFVATYSGLNYETISLAGLPPYVHSSGSKFEPRCEPMRIERAGDQRVVLVQPETSHAHVSARITFSMEEPYFLHQRIELIFHRRFCAAGEKNTFRSLWASYMHMPTDRHVYTKINDPASNVEGWSGVTKEDHGSREYLIRPLPVDRELQATEHLKFMTNSTTLYTEPTPGSPPSLGEIPTRLSGPLGAYYGFCHEMLFLMIFRQPEQFRFAYSPCGAGKQPAWNPAWDYILCIEDAQLEYTYSWDLCLVVKKYQSRVDVMDEVRRYRAKERAV